MKRILSILSILGFCAVSCKKDNTVVPEEIAVSKKVAYHVFAAKTYSEPIFDNARAEVNLTIAKTNLSTGATVVVWDTLFTSRQLSDFPQFANKFVIEKQFPVLESKEKLNGSFWIKYNNNGLISQEAKGAEIGQGENLIFHQIDL